MTKQIIKDRELPKVIAVITFLVSFICGTVFGLVPMLLKTSSNLSLWLVASFPTLCTLFRHMFSSSKYINKLALQFNLKVIAIMYVLVAAFGLGVTYLIDSDIALIVYTLVFAFTFALRGLNVSGAIILHRESIQLTKYHNLAGFSSDMLGLLLGQILIQMKPEYFVVFIVMSASVSVVLISLVGKREVKETTTSLTGKETKQTGKLILNVQDVRKFRAVGIVFGIQAGINNIFYGLTTYQFILNTDNYGYYMALQGIITIIGVGLFQKYLHQSNFKVVNSIKTFTAFSSYITAVLLVCVKPNLVTLVIVCIFFSFRLVTGASTFNYLVTKLNSKEVYGERQKDYHNIIMSYYNKAIIPTSLLFIPISKNYENLTTSAVIVMMLVGSIILAIIHKTLIYLYNLGGLA